MATSSATASANPHAAQGPELRLPEDATTVLHRRKQPGLPQGLTPQIDAARTRLSNGAAQAWPYIRRGLKYLGLAAAAYICLVLVLIVAFRFIDPPGSALMALRTLQGTSVKQTWVPLEKISKNLVRAVVIAEDSRFCQHNGIDFEELERAISRSGTGGGASTISMQVTKNMFLWPSRSYIRKAIELTLTPVVELVWPKHRILEVYLNIAEWGHGVFGAEAAARQHFRRSAARISARQAALMASVLPNPIRRKAGRPGRHTNKKANVVRARVKANRSVAACVTSQYAELQPAKEADPTTRAPSKSRAAADKKPATRSVQRPRRKPKPSRSAQEEVFPKFYEQN